MFGVIFQDFIRYEFTIKENIAVGNIDELDNFEKIEWDNQNILICDDECLDPTVFPSQSTMFIATLTNVNGCSITDSIFISVTNAGRVYIPNAFSPNLDGKNDVFEIKGAEFCDYIFEVQIFNRWGNIVYQSDDYQNDWNAVAPNSSFGSSGTVPSGTYYYIVNVKNSDLKTINGFLYIGAN